MAGYEDRTDKEYRRLTILQSKIHLMLNPNEDDHQQLGALIGRMISSIEYERRRPDEFQQIHTEVMTLSMIVLRREWNVAKEPISFTCGVNKNR